MFRNFAAMKGKTEFDKRLIKGTYGHDKKEPKEKHVRYLMACLKGAHAEVSASQALMKILQRFIENTEFWAVNIKIYIILHRCLQDYDLSKSISRELKEKVEIFTHFKKKPTDNTYDSKMNVLLTQLYCDYMKMLISFNTKSEVLTVRISEVTRKVKKMKTKDLFFHYESFDAMIGQILSMFENNDYCRKHRIHQNFVYMNFLDLVKIYNVFYILTMETLDRYKRMSTTEMNKALILYKNFCGFTDSLKKQASTIPMMFGFTFKEPNYYKADPKKERAMKNALRDKEAGGFDGAEDSFGDEMPEFDDAHDVGAIRDDEYKEEEDDDEYSDDDYDFDLLGEIKKQEEMASVHGSAAPRRGKTMAVKKEKIKVDDFNTAALDDLLGESNPPSRSETIKEANIESEFDPFGAEQENVYSEPPPAATSAAPKAPAASSKGIFDDEDMWGDKTAAQPSKQDQKQALEDILGGETTEVAADPYGSAAVGAAPTQAAAPGGTGNDFDVLKNLYNTTSAPAAPAQPMGAAQADPFSTSMPAASSMPAGGYGMAGGYQQNMGYSQGYGGGMAYGGGAAQYNTGYATGGYSGGATTGYGGYGAGAGYGGGMTGGYTTQATPGYGYEQTDATGMGAGMGGTAPQPATYGTTAPAAKQTNDFDPFA